MSQNNAPNRKRSVGSAGTSGGGGGERKNNHRGGGSGGGKNDRRKSEPYCGVCFKAGKEKSVYTSHWTRENANQDSPIVCPLILSTVCGYCKETGHSIKYCEKRIRKNNRLQENASICSTGNGLHSKNSSHASLASIDSLGGDSYNRPSRRQNRKRDGPYRDKPIRPTVNVTEDKPAVPPPPSKWLSAVEDGNAMKLFPTRDLNNMGKGTFDSNGRRVLDEWVPTIISTDKDPYAPIMPLPPSQNDVYDDILCSFTRKRIHTWDDCDMNQPDHAREHTPISMRDLNDVSPYHIPSSSSESSCNEDDFDPEYDSYLLEV